MIKEITEITVRMNQEESNKLESALAKLIRKDGDIDDLFNGEIDALNALWEALGSTGKG